MNCFYINLDSAVERRKNIEINFNNINNLDNVLNRVRAIDVHDVINSGITGSISSTELACFCSHSSIIESNKLNNDHLHIMEDDVLLSDKTFPLLDKLIKNIDSTSWDIIFTDVCIPNPRAMVDLFELKKKYRNNKTINVLDLKKIAFAGATSYVINKNSVQIVADIIDRKNKFDIPFDLFLRNEAYAGNLKCIAPFPFLTSLSSDSFTSQIQAKELVNTDFVWNIFRKFIWIDGDSASINNEIAKIQSTVNDSESRTLSIIISACLSENFISK